MRLTRVRLGKLITQIKDKNINLELTPWDISGINSDKYFFEPSRQVGKDLTKYKNVPQNCFACNLMHVGRDKVLPISLNNTEKIKVVSPAYTVFEINKRNILLDTYFFMMLKSDEKDRYFWYFTDSSVRDGLDWNDFCDIELELPPIEIQQKYVDIYNAMVENQKSYEKGLEDLKLVIDAYIDTFKKENSKEPVKNLIRFVDKKNTDNSVKFLKGINIYKKFMDSASELSEKSLSKYKIVNKGQFAFSGMQTGRDKCIRIAHHIDSEPIIISPAYEVFEVTSELIIPEYFMMWFSRNEIDRLGWFMSDSSIRSNLDIERFEEMLIPVPSKDIQQSIVNIYKVYQERKEINEKLKQQIKDICPILIKGSIEEARK
jgi:hypothetical protein